MGETIPCNPTSWKFLLALFWALLGLDSNVLDFRLSGHKVRALPCNPNWPQRTESDGAFNESRTNDDVIVGPTRKKCKGDVVAGFMMYFCASLYTFTSVLCNRSKVPYDVPSSGICFDVSLPKQSTFGFLSRRTSGTIAIKVVYIHFVKYLRMRPPAFYLNGKSVSLRLKKGWPGVILSPVLVALQLYPVGPPGYLIIDFWMLIISEYIFLRFDKFILLT